ncbi:PCYCGC motif-containing (lipo)protein [Burkholderia pseudomallei]|uniref:PCYCGC motif-containing (lipo)protein n=1 Tax=Burkholderia pseudomallei TaxID=28450 RepID=UPI0006A5E18D|nr:PCYCGC motif-containing (lipo)protein [Burkholderia pseudomallei]
MKRYKRHQSGSAANERSGRVVKVRLNLLSLLALILAISTALVWGPSLVHWAFGPKSAAITLENTVQQIPGWRVGMLRPDGLRIISSGVSDASHVLNPVQFPDKAVRHAYWVAAQIPATLNKLYCWCGCENRGEHRSNLQCFEDKMAVSCPVCQGTAEIAYQMTQAGVRDAAKIQAAVDAKWAPKG